MENNQRVVWSEGMLLTPQLFQQWDQYYESHLNERFHALIAFGYGVLRLDFDHDGLLNGRVTLLGFQGILPDGLIVRIPEEEIAPQTRLIGPPHAHSSRIGSNTSWWPAPPIPMR